MAEHAVQIKLLGGFEILVNGRAVLGKLQQSKKTRQLLEYLILKQGKSATHEELLSNIWSDKNSSNPATALRTLLHRYRTLVEDQGIVELSGSVLTSRGGYRWNPNLDCAVDAFEMERLITEAKASKTKEREALLGSAIEYYRGPLLPASSDESWVVTKSAYYRDMYLNALFEYIDILKEQGEHAAIVQACRKALDVEPFEERVNMELMMALENSGRSDDAYSHYQHGAMQYGAQPDAMHRIYFSLLSAGTQLDDEIDRLHAKLDTEPRMTGAYVCEYSVFAEIFELQRRLLERYNTTMFLCLIGLNSCDDRSPLAVESLMSKLMEALRTNLRHGDTVSRYGAARYAVLLPATTHESAGMIMGRVKDVFYASQTDTAVTINYKLRPLDVSEEK